MELTEFHGSLILSSGALLWAFASPFWGNKSEVWGRKPVFVFGLFGYGIASFFFGYLLSQGLLETFPVITLVILLMLVRASIGVLLSASPTSALAYVADVTEGEKRTQGLAFISAAMGIGTILGPGIGGLVVGLGLVAPIYLAAVLALIGASISLVFLQKPVQHVTINKTKPMSFFDPRVRSLLIIGFFMFLTLSNAQIVMGFYFQDRLALSPGETARQVGLAFAIKGIAAIFAQMWLVRVICVSPIKLIKLGMPIILLSIILFILGDSFLLLSTGMVFMGLGVGLSQPGFYSATSFAVGQDEQGSVAGLSSATMAISSVVGQLFGGVFYMVENWLPFVISGVFIAINIFLVYLIKTEKSGRALAKLTPGDNCE